MPEILRKAEPIHFFHYYQKKRVYISKTISTAHLNLSFLANTANKKLVSRNGGERIAHTG